MARVDTALRPIARRSLDVNSRVTNLRRDVNPLDEAGVRAETEASLRQLMRYYAAGDEETRDSIRELLGHYSSFAWAAVLPLRPGDRESVREQFIHFSMLDQGGDPRDAVLWLGELCARSGLPDDEVAFIRHEVAAMSSTVDRYGFGSTASMLRDGYGAGAS